MTEYEDGFDVVMYEAEYLDGETVRVYDQDEYWHSAAYTEEGRHFDLVFEYMKKFDLLFEHMPSDSRILMLGGGGYSYPKHIISHFPEAAITVVDPDPYAEATARQYFYLNELIREYDPENTGRLKSVTAEGREFLENADEIWDVIINDAFVGGMPVFHLSTLEAFRLMKQHLRPGGMAVVNLPGWKETGRSQFLKDTMRTAAEVFRFVQAVPAVSSEEAETCNYVLFASDCYDTMTGQLSIDMKEGHIMQDSELEQIEASFDY